MLFPYVYINGDILPLEDARIPVYDLGLLRGYALFDFFRVIDGIPVFAENHIDRLENSLKLMRLQTDLSREQWHELFYKMIKVNAVTRAGFRVIVSGGFSEDGYSIPEKKNVYLMLHQLPEDVPIPYQQGVRLLTVDYQRDMPLAKSTNYLESMLLQPEMKAQGAFEVLYHQGGIIRECSRCNIFFIDQKGEIHTPDQDVLRGITRLKVLESIRETGIPVHEREIHLHELSSVAGAFLTATTKGVLPVDRIGDQIIGDGQVHPLAKSLHEAYEQKVARYIEEAQQKRNR